MKVTKCYWKWEGGSHPIKRFVVPRAWVVVMKKSTRGTGWGCRSLSSKCIFIHVSSYNMLVELLVSTSMQRTKYVSMWRDITNRRLSPGVLSDNLNRLCDDDGEQTVLLVMMLITWVSVVPGSWMVSGSIVGPCDTLMYSCKCSWWMAWLVSERSNYWLCGLPREMHKKCLIPSIKWG